MNIQIGNLKGSAVIKKKNLEICGIGLVFG